MRKSQIIYTILTAILLLCLCFIFSLLLYVSKFEPNSITTANYSDPNSFDPAKPVVSETSDPVNAFVKYDYTETHPDGSYANYVVYKYKNDYCLYTKCVAPNGSAFIKNNKLSKEVAKDFENKYKSFQLAPDETEADLDQTEQHIITDAKLHLTSSMGTTIYDIQPIDLSRLQIVDLWSDNRPITIQNVTTELKNIFDMTTLKDLSNYYTDAELAAYISSLYQQLKEKLTNTPTNVSVKETAEDGYIISVTTLGSNKPVLYEVSNYGYVGKQL